MPQDPLIGHAHAMRLEAEDAARTAIHENVRLKDCLNAIRASVRYSDGPVSAAFLRSTLAAYNLGDS